MPPPPLPSVSVPRSPTSIGIGATLWLHRFIYRASSKSAERRRQEEEKYNEDNYVGKNSVFCKIIHLLQEERGFQGGHELAA